MIIKSADKGRCVTIISKDQYIAEGRQHLAQPLIYERIDHDYTKKLTITINLYLKGALNNHWISKDIYHALRRNPDTTRQQLLYFLWKVHKDPHEIRPIISGTCGPTENISAFVDEILGPYVSSCRHVVTNTTQVINILESTPYTDDSIIATLDVKALYLQIPQEEGVRWVLDRVYGHPQPPSTPRALLEQLLAYILKDNIFTFNNGTYRQTSGIAMGTRCAPTFANLYMAILEEGFMLRRVRNKLPIPTTWLRYIDDVLVVWEHSSDSLDNYIESIDEFHYSIRFTSTKGPNTINFVDINIYKGERFGSSNILDIAPYAKECHTFSYLHYSSCHPPSTFKGVTIGETKRILRNSSNIQTYEHHVQLLMNNLQRRGYPRAKLKKWLSDITFANRINLLNKETKSRLIAAENTYLRSPYHPGYSLHNLKTAISCAALPFTPTIIAIPRPSIGKQLVRSKITTGQI